MGSRSASAIGMMISTSIAQATSALCQPRLAISWPSTGTMKNWPNEPAAAATPMAQERFSAGIWRPITP